MTFHPHIPKLGKSSSQESDCWAHDRRAFCKNKSQEGGYFTGMDFDRVASTAQKSQKTIFTHDQQNDQQNDQGETPVCEIGSQVKMDETPSMNYCPQSACINRMLHELHEKELVVQSEYDRQCMRQCISSMLMPCAFLAKFQTLKKLAHTHSTNTIRFQCICDKPDCFIYLRNSNASNSPIIPICALRALPTSGMQYSTMPDLSFFIRMSLLKRHFSIVIPNGASSHFCVDGNTKRSEGRSRNANTRALPSIEENMSKSWLILVLTEALPCIVLQGKKGIRNQIRLEPNSYEINVCLCLLYGTLLQLYPRSSKSPTFASKVKILVRIWDLNNKTSPEKVTFINEHINLIKLCCMEYCYNVLHDYLPVELKALMSQPGMREYCNNAGVMFDAFRRDCIFTGDEDWDTLDSYCRGIIDRCYRTSRVRPASYDFFNIVKPCKSQNDVKMWMWDCPNVWGNRHALTIMYPETDKQSLATISILQKIICTYLLPVDVRKKQESSLERIHGYCQYVKDAKSVIHMCSACACSGKLSLNRYVTFQFLPLFLYFPPKTIERNSDT